MSMGRGQKYINTKPTMALGVMACDKQGTLGRVRQRTHAEGTEPQTVSPGKYHREINMVGFFGKWVLPLRLLPCVNGLVFEFGKCCDKVKSSAD